jgi:hypothetical protein
VKAADVLGDPQPFRGAVQVGVDDAEARTFGIHAIDKLCRWGLFRAVDQFIIREDFAKI